MGNIANGLFMAESCLSETTGKFMAKFPESYQVPNCYTTPTSADVCIWSAILFIQIDYSYFMYISILMLRQKESHSEIECKFHGHQ